MNDLTLLTPTFARDIDRFRLQRESIEQCGIELPHIAVVHDEDVEQFQSVPHRKNLRILSTSEVLGANIDRRRRAFRVRRLNPLHWTVRKPIAGWMNQQLVKLAAAQFIETDAVAALDSDIFFIDRVTAEDFHTGGKLHLYETTTNIDVQMAEWLCRSMKFLGINPAGQPLKQYIHHPFLMHREVLREFYASVSQRAGKPWIEAVLDGNVFECTTYGAFARHIHGMKLLEAAEPRLTLSYWWPEQVASFERDFLERVRGGSYKIVLIQSNAAKDTAEYRRLIEQAWSGNKLSV